jgi:hypothetical protein
MTRAHLLQVKSCHRLGEHLRVALVILHVAAARAHENAIACCRDWQENERQLFSSAVQQSTACQICHAAVAYIRAALANDETQREIEMVRAIPPCQAQKVGRRSLLACRSLLA